jgi:hypothetical protein
MLIRDMTGELRVWGDGGAIKNLLDRSNVRIKKRFSINKKCPWSKKTIYEFESDPGFFLIPDLRDQGFSLRKFEISKYFDRRNAVPVVLYFILEFHKVLIRSRRVRKPSSL